MNITDTQDASILDEFYKMLNVSFLILRIGNGSFNHTLIVIPV